jgi:hypothetical protein
MSTFLSGGTDHPADLSADERYGGASPTYKLVSLGIKAAEPASDAAVVQE